jgi:hypothetical protein
MLIIIIIIIIIIITGTRGSVVVKALAASRKVVGSRPDKVNGLFKFT